MYKRQGLRQDHGRKEVWRGVSYLMSFTPVSYTHLDVYKRQIEGNAAVRRAFLGSKYMELSRLYSDVPEFRQRLHREVIDETYPKLHELSLIHI